MKVLCIRRTFIDLHDTMLSGVRCKRNKSAPPEVGRNTGPDSSKYLCSLAENAEDFLPVYNQASVIMNHSSRLPDEQQIPRKVSTLPQVALPQVASPSETQAKPEGQRPKKIKNRALYASGEPGSKKCWMIDDKLGSSKYFPRWQEPDRDSQHPHESSTSGKKNNTLVVGAVTCGQTIHNFVETIGQSGFDNTYEFVYVPPRKGRNIDYAFVSFKTPEYAASFVQVFQQFFFPSCPSIQVSQ